MKFFASQQLKRRHIGFYVGLVVADCIFFTLTNPSKVPSVVLIVGFFLVALSLNGLLRLLLMVLTVYGLPFGRHGRRLALFCSIAGGAALALQSVGELTARDGVVLLLLGVLSYLYVSYGRPQRQV